MSMLDWYFNYLNVYQRWLAKNPERALPIEIVVFAASMIVALVFYILVNNELYPFLLIAIGAIALASLPFSIVTRNQIKTNSDNYSDLKARIAKYERGMKLMADHSRSKKRDRD